jgi:hypothetical protein
MHAPSKMAQFPAQFDGSFPRVYSYSSGGHSRGLKRMKLAQALGEPIVMSCASRKKHRRRPPPGPQNKGRNPDGVPPMSRCIAVTDGSIARGGHLL